MTDNDHSGETGTRDSGTSIPWARIGAALAGLATIAGAIVAILAFRADRSDKTKAQAEKVSAWIADESERGTRAIIRNTSEGPIHHVVALLVLEQGAGPHTGKQAVELGLEGTSTTWLAIPPGRWQVTFTSTAGGMFTRPGIELAFQDAAGRSWLRSASGSLMQLKKSPEQYYGLPQPLDWEAAPARAP